MIRIGIVDDHPALVVGTSTIASTPWSYHCRAMAEPVSGRFWWSAWITSTESPSGPAKSATACCVQMTLPIPVGSR